MMMMMIATRDIWEDSITCLMFVMTHSMFIDKKNSQEKQILFLTNIISSIDTKYAKICDVCFSFFVINFLVTISRTNICLINSDSLIWIGDLAGSNSCLSSCLVPRSFNDLSSTTYTSCYSSFFFFCPFLFFLSSTAVSKETRSS